MTGCRVTFVESCARLNSVSAADSCVIAAITSAATSTGIALSTSERLMMLS
jgi:hypothetical protein